MPLVAQNPGVRDRRISLRYPVAARDAIGAVVNGWAELDPIWAGYTPNSGRERFAADAIYASAECVFRIRYRASVDATWRVVNSGKLYDLVAPPIEIGRRNYLDLPVRTFEQSPADPDIPGAHDVYALAQVFELALEDGAEQVEVVYPQPFGASPRGLSVTVLMPTGGYNFAANPIEDTRTALGFTVQLGAAVPGAGYKLSITAIP